MSDRILQINEVLIQKLAFIFSQKLEIPIEFFISITKVECAPNLKTAKVFISVIPFSQSRDGLAFIIRNRKEIQKLLGKNNRMKYTPQLTFLLDTTQETVSEIEQLIDEL